MTVLAAEGLDKTFYSSEENTRLKDAFSVVAGFDDEVPSLLEDIFETNSKQQYEMFIESVLDRATWIFDATQIRERIH